MKADFNGAIVTVEEFLDSIGLRPEDLGKEVQNSWAEMAREMPNAPESWKRTWEEVTPKMKEMDIQIGMAVAARINMVLGNRLMPRDFNNAETKTDRLS